MCQFVSLEAGELFEIVFSVFLVLFISHMRGAHVRKCALQNATSVHSKSNFSCPVSHAFKNVSKVKRLFIGEASSLDAR